MKWYTNKGISIFLVFTLLLSYVCFADVPPKDEYDIMRERWKAMLTGGDDCNLEDVRVSGAVTAASEIAQTYWDTMYKESDRVSLWKGIAFGSDPANITTTFNRLEAMAVACCTRGSELEGDDLLRADIVSAVEWMYNRTYNENTTAYGNWWHWQIGTPMSFNNVVVLMYEHFTNDQIEKYMRAVDRFQPDVTMTGANRAWECVVIGVRGVIGKNSERIATAQNGLSPIFSYVTARDGFYRDGSFVQHNYFSYTGGYGRSLIETVADMLNLLNGTTWDISDAYKEIVYNWVYDSYMPVIYKGTLMDMTRGREISREYAQSEISGANMMCSILNISLSAPKKYSYDYQSMIKYWLKADPYNSFFADDTPIRYIDAASKILADDTIQTAEAPRLYKQFSGMDRAVQFNGDYAFGISMHSNNIRNYESINSENGKGWHTSDGMTYLYTKDVAQFNENYWPTANFYRLPGTTVVSNSTATADRASDKNFVGGADMQGLYGVTGMELHPIEKTLNAKKSWFMFDDEIVALGSGISSMDNAPIETIVESRRLKTDNSNAFTVDGVQWDNTLGASGTFNAPWAHLEGNAEDSGVGYYFPGGGAITVHREARQGAWHNLQSISSASKTIYDNNFLTMYFDHGINPDSGKYSYVLLPNVTKEETAAYAEKSNIVILENSADVQAVKDEGLNIIGANFWNDKKETVDMITSSKKASVMTKETAEGISLSVSDPTKANTDMIQIELNRAAKGITACDSRISVTQLSPTIKLWVDVNGAMGESFKAEFSYIEQENSLPLTLLNPIITKMIEDENFESDNFSVEDIMFESNLVKKVFKKGETPIWVGELINNTVSFTTANPAYDEDLIECDTGAPSKTVNNTNYFSTGSGKLTRASGGEDIRFYHNLPQKLTGSEMIYVDVRIKNPSVENLFFNICQDEASSYNNSVTNKAISISFNNTALTYRPATGTIAATKSMSRGHWVYIRAALDLKNQTAAMYCGETLETLRPWRGKDESNVYAFNTKVNGISSLSFNGKGTLAVDDVRVYRGTMPAVVTKANFEDNLLKSVDVEYPNGFPDTAVFCAAVYDVNTNELVDVELQNKTCSSNIVFEKSMSVNSNQYLKVYIWNSGGQPLTATAFYLKGADISDAQTLDLQ